MIIRPMIFKDSETNELALIGSRLPNLPTVKVSVRRRVDGSLCALVASCSYLYNGKPVANLPLVVDYRA